MHFPSLTPKLFDDDIPATVDVAGRYSGADLFAICIIGSDQAIFCVPLQSGISCDTRLIAPLAMSPSVDVVSAFLANWQCFSRAISLTTIGVQRKLARR